MPSYFEQLLAEEHGLEISIALRLAHLFLIRLTVCRDAVSIASRPARA